MSAIVRGYLEYSVIGACAKPHSLYGVVEQVAAFAVEGAVFLYHA